MNFNTDIFEQFDKKWALLTAGAENSFNTMTISWGGMGTLWNKPVVSFTKWDSWSTTGTLGLLFTTSCKILIFWRGENATEMAFFAILRGYIEKKSPNKQIEY